MIDIVDLLKHRFKLNQDTLDELQQQVEKYPYFHTARLLYVLNLFVLHDRRFGEELRKASVCVPDRTALFNMIEGVNYNLDDKEADSAPIMTEGDEERTVSLIDSFLSTTVQSGDQQTAYSEDNKPSLLDATNDYASFLIRQDEEQAKQGAPQNTPQLKGQELIDNFIEKTKGHQRVEIPDSEPDFDSPEISDDDAEIYTETMTNIYIKQGRYSQALEILKRICLNNPKKSAYFANQMKLLQVIIDSQKETKG